jgi:hypothetical protein
VIAMLRGHGWRIIDPADAFADPIYASPPDGLPAGHAVIWSLARARGIAGLGDPAEDADHEKAKLDAAGL